MDMVEYTTVDRADTLVPLFCQSSAPVCSQDVVTPDHSLLTVLALPIIPQDHVVEHVVQERVALHGLLR